MKYLMNSDDASPVYGYLQNPSMVDFAGRLAAVFFTAGCNFKCGFCHNAELIGASRTGMSWRKLGQGCQRFVRDWVDGAVITGGEPTLSPKLLDLIHFLKKQGWAVKLDTNGSNPEQLSECLPLIDYIAMDIKAGLSGYPALAGFDEVDRLKRSIDLIKGGAVEHEFRTTILESFHDDEQMVEIAGMVAGAQRYIVQPFVPSDEVPLPAYRETKRTSAGRLEEVAAIVSGCVDEVCVRGK